MVKAKKYVVSNIFKGPIKNTDLNIVEEELPEIQLGECLIEALFISVDPYQRAWAERYTVGQDMIGTQVAKVIQTKSKKYPLGAIVIANVGWRTYSIIRENSKDGHYLLPDIGGLPLSLGVGMLGMPGNTAYFGFLELCKPKEGETVVVTGAGGAVGSHVGQLAKIKRCNVIGITGDDSKAKWLKSIGFDHVINYKTCSNISQELKNCAPNGVDCYFDNVGGKISSLVIRQMNQFGRIACCGSIVSYDAVELPLAPMIQRDIVHKQLTMTGFMVDQFKDRWMEGINQNLQWILDLKLKYRETVTEGFENMTQALANVMKGKNVGKAVVKIASYDMESEFPNFKASLNRFLSKE